MNIILEKNYDNKYSDAIGAKYLLANGYFGYRGTLDEDKAEDMVAVNLNGLFDKVEDHLVESVNCFNPLFTRCILNGEAIHRKVNLKNEHRIELNLNDGVFSRVTKFEYKEATITIRSERFIDQKNHHMIYSNYVITADKPVTVEMINGIDTNVWNFEGEHLQVTGGEKEGQKIVVLGQTYENKKQILVGLMAVKNFKHRDFSDDSSYFKYFLNIEPDREYQIYKYACIMHSDDVDYFKLEEYLENAKEIGYERIKTMNHENWQSIWDDARVEVINNNLADKISQYAVFQLISHRPYSDNVSIPNKGLSGQFQSGSTSWVNELFLFPFYLNTFPDAARHMVMNRIHGLKGALDLAKHFNYEGAFYPANSISDGSSIDYDMEEKEFIHVNGLIVYALYDYIVRTDDISVLLEGGLEMAIECAKFYCSYASLNSTETHYDFKNVSGVDHNHRNVTNSALTNRLIKHNLDVVLKMVAIVKAKERKYWDKLFEEKNYTEDILKVREIRRKFYLKNPNVRNIMEQFDGYFDLEDISLKDWKKLSKTSDFDSTKYQIIENPEVFELSYLFPDEYDYIVKKANYEFYFRRLSSRLYMSKTMSLIMACELDNSRRAYRQFLKLAEIDITKTKKFYHGLDIFNCGAIYLSLVYGFAGLRFNDYLVTCNYWIPYDIRRLEFHIKHLNHKGFVKIKRNITSIEWE